jgi:hypothetical protein
MRLAPWQRYPALQSPGEVAADDPALVGPPPDRLWEKEPSLPLGERPPQVLPSEFLSQEIVGAGWRVTRWPQIDRRRLSASARSLSR